MLNCTTEYVLNEKFSKVAKYTNCKGIVKFYLGA